MDERARHVEAPANVQVKRGAIDKEFLNDCDGNVLAAFASCQEWLRASGADVQSFDAQYWDNALSIYAPIQAHEAAAIHARATGGDYSCFPAPIHERLAWGASLSTEEVQQQRQRHAEFRNRVDE